MKRLVTSIVGGAACALALVIPGAANQQPAKTPTTHSAALTSAWPQENLSGTITMADPKADLLVVTGPEGVPFDMVITPRTHIWSGNRKVSLDDLQRYQNKRISVRFVPARQGDVAESIRITG